LGVGVSEAPLMVRPPLTIVPPLTSDS